MLYPPMTATLLHQKKVFVIVKRVTYALSNPACDCHSFILTVGSKVWLSL